MFWLACAFLFTILQGTYGKRISKDSCYSGELLFNHCHCGVITPTVHSMSHDIYSNTEGKLICTGPGAVKAASKVNELSEELYIHFTGLEISNSENGNLLYNNLKEFSTLKKLHLLRNGIDVINPLLFNSFVELESLDLSYNKIVTVKKDAFQYLKKLKNLSLANNEITSIDADSFHHLSELLHLDLSGNSLYSIDSNWFSGSEKLLSLNVASNEIFAIKPDSFQHLSSLQQLNLAENKLEDLPHAVLYGLKNLKRLSVAMNNLRTLNENVFKGNKLLEQVNLTGNFWVCDKQLLPLNDWLKTHEVDKSYCAEPPEFRNSSLQTGLYILYLEIKLDESPICNASMCNCTVSKDKQVVTVDCIGRGFTKLPESLPYKTRVLDLRSNYIKSLTTDHVNATQWADVSFLHLNNNLIDSLKGLEGTWLLRNLVALHLTNNKLTEIPIHILEQFRGGLLDELYLSGNPWNCDCNTVRFQTWLQDNYKTIKDFNGIRCSAESGVYSNQPIYRLLKSQLCPQDVELINSLDILNGLMAVVIVLIIVKLSYDFWLQKQTGKLPRFFSLNI